MKSGAAVRPSSQNTGKAIIRIDFNEQIAETGAARRNVGNRRIHKKLEKTAERSNGLRVEPQYWQRGSNKAEMSRLLPREDYPPSH